ncbi:Crp/Fnr family transcriptional regulator [Streptomyces spectabilis]|uniref:Crp/Fnr family transcriptional regulator n=1 Tax=Streptomyces spectabilis TaxID=68270 RepID=A0A516R300_STRST|nr:Crp/Fnr family transcriptional regulator [Streptomyces spectabilis]QDQ10020.1 Crp/Fnr family transcriptional regulator [Streptomyces spectabilis]
MGAPHAPYPSDVPYATAADPYAAVPLLVGLPAPALADFDRLAAHGTFRRRTPVFVEGEEGDCVFVVLSGKVKVTRPDPDGKDVLFAMVGPGQLLGELCVFDGGTRHSTATAVRDTDVCWVAAAAMRGWLGRHPEASLRMMRLLATRIRGINDRLEDVTGVDVATRVARALVEQASRFGRRTPLGPRFSLDLSQDELARHVRASRERVNQVLMDFSRRGWVLREGGEWIVLDPSGLTRRARYRPETAARRPAIVPSGPRRATGLKRSWAAPSD